jgi:hypothetical protein
MKRILISVLSIVALAGVLLGISGAPAQAGLTSCPSGVYYGAGDSRIQFSPSANVWYTPRMRASHGSCNGIYVRHDGHFGYLAGTDVNDGFYKLLTFRSDGSINYESPWTRFSAFANTFTNMRPEVSDGRWFAFRERPAPCLFSDCVDEHKPIFEVRF